MKIMIMRQEGLVGLDGGFVQMDLSELPKELRIVHFDEELAQGHEEWTDRRNTKLVGIEKYSAIIKQAIGLKKESDARAADPYYGLNQKEKRVAQKAEAKKELAAKRYEKEVSGIKVDGILFSTDRESIQLFSLCADKLRLGLADSVIWKAPFNWVELTRENVNEIDLALFNHIQEAFLWEKAEEEKIK